MFLNIFNLSVLISSRVFALFSNVLYSFSLNRQKKRQQKKIQSDILRQYNSALNNGFFLFHSFKIHEFGLSIRRWYSMCLLHIYVRRKKITYLVPVVPWLSFWLNARRNFESQPRANSSDENILHNASNLDTCVFSSTSKS